MSYKNKNGFTLLEMLVVVAIFSMMVIVIASILNSVLLSRRLVVAKEKLQSDSNSIIEIMAKNIRVSVPDYQSYSDLSQPTETLALVDRDDNRIIFRASNNEGYCNRSPDFCLVLQVGETGSPINVTPTGIELVDIKFYIEPATDPFALDPVGRSDKQPLVAIVLKTQASVGRGQSKVSNVIQTTVSPRFYKQRQF